MKASRFTAAHQSMTFSRRMMLVGGAQFAFGGILVARLGYLSIAQNQHYKLLSESNRVQLIPVPPRRISIAPPFFMGCGVMKKLCGTMTRRSGSSRATAHF